MDENIVSRLVGLDNRSPSGTPGALLNPYILMRSHKPFKGPQHPTLIAKVPLYLVPVETTDNTTLDVEARATCRGLDAV